MAARSIGLDVVEAPQIDRLTAIRGNLRIVGPFQIENILRCEEAGLVVGLRCAGQASEQARQKDLFYHGVPRIDVLRALDAQLSNAWQPRMFHLDLNRLGDGVDERVAEDLEGNREGEPRRDIDIALDLLGTDTELPEIVEAAKFEPGFRHPSIAQRFGRHRERVSVEE